MSGVQRITIAHRNVPNMVGQISTALADAKLNIEHMINNSRGDYAYTIIDLENKATDDSLARIKAIEGVLRVRVI